MTDPSPYLEVGAADILRLIQGYLTSVGLHESNRVLREESGIGAAGVPHRMLPTWAAQGRWGLVLRSLAILDRERCRLNDDLVAEVHEMAILELAAVGDFELAYAAYRLAQSDLEISHVVYHRSSSGAIPGEKISRSRHVEQKLAALAAARSKDPSAQIPDDYYDGKTRDEVRKDLGERLEVIPEQPPNRLTSLIQQAIKYQSYTGELPKIKELWPSEGEDENDTGTTTTTRKKKRRKVFDLVLGTTTSRDGAAVVVGENSSEGRCLRVAESVPSKPMATISFGKKAVCESAAFLPDGSGLVTGSSDGLIEIWDAAKNFGELRRDLPYQKKDELLGHDTAVTALAVSNDGAMLASGDGNGRVHIWRIDTGTCLGIIQCHSAAVSCIQFSPSGSHILTAGQDSKCREFGLRTSKMLKEFAGHDSYVNSCFYSIHPAKTPAVGLKVITGSADGKVRIFDGSTAECVAVLRPTGGGEEAREGSSIVMDTANSSSSGAATDAAIACVLPLHTPSQSLIIIPRTAKAILVNHSGVVLKVYEEGTTTSAFCAATVSPSNGVLSTVREDGVLCLFDIETGQFMSSIANFGLESTSGNNNDTSRKTGSDTMSLVNHPYCNNMIAAYSNDKASKLGRLVVWK